MNNAGGPVWLEVTVTFPRLARHDRESVRTSDVGSLHVQTGRQTDLGQSVELHLGRGEQVDKG